LALFPWWRSRLPQAPQPRHPFSANSLPIRSFESPCGCGAHFGDFYHFGEPGGAFFSTDENEASEITFEELPLTGTFGLDCSYGMGLGDLIFEHAKMINSHE
jgi:hypothetical protein